MSFAVRDAAKSVTKALPNGASAITTDPIDLEVSDNGDFVARCELLIEAPALATADLGDAATMTYAVVHGNEDDLSDAEVLADEVLVQTGAGGTGADAADARYRLPSNVKRYVGVRATNSAAGDASDKSVAASLVF